MTDLDQLLRDTLHGRAATITEAPAPAGTASGRRERSPWLLVAATVATVLIAGGGAAVWGLGRGSSPHQSGGGYARTCRAALPAAWKAAFAVKPLTIDGHDTSVEAVTPFGDVVSWATGRRDLVAHVGLRAPDGATRTLFVGAPGDSVSTSADGADLVLSVTPTRDNDPYTVVDDIVAVDLRSLTVRHVLRHAQAPAGTVVADKTAEVLDGTVYWAAVPAGSVRTSSTGTVLAYTLATGRTRVVGHAGLLLSADPRGIFWDGGGVTARNVPAAVPAPRAGGYDPVVSDGQNFAWLRADRPRVVGWTDAHGDERLWNVDTVGRHDVRSDPRAVSDHFVFLEPMGYGNAHYYILDTRTGAVADSGLQAFGGSALGARAALITRADNDGPFATTVIDTAHLPELHC